MKILSISQLVPGMVTSEDVYNFDHQLILPGQTVLSDLSITRLYLYGIQTVAVEGDSISSSDNHPDTASSTGSMDTCSFDPDLSSGPSYYSRIRSSPEFHAFKKEYEAGLNSFRQVMNQVVRRNLTIDVDDMVAYAMRILSTASSKFGILDMLQNMREYDDSTFTHSMNVGLICNIFSGWLHQSEEETRLATASGLLHDVGKLLVPHHIISKPSALSDSEYDLIKKHPLEGYKLLQLQNVDEGICNVALLHHERHDGSGYPLGLTGEAISPLSSIVAIADVYDAMTSPRVYRGPLCPFQAIELFEKEGIQKYNSGYVLTFLDHVVKTYLQTNCRLNDGRKGTIIYINPHKLSRPVVHCGDAYVDLSTAPNQALYIETIL